MSLTEDAVRELIVTNKADNPTFEPVLQVVSIKSVGGTRYRTVLSDGKFFVQGMLATQLNHLVTSNELKRNSLICVQDFMNNAVQGRNVIILLKVQVLQDMDDKIGDPQDIEKLGANNLAASNASANQNNKSLAAPPMYASSNSNINRANPYGGTGNSSAGLPSKNPYSPAGPASRSNAPIVHHGTSAASPSGSGQYTLISQLNMYQNRWTIKTRVVSKSDVRTWSNAKGEGSLFSVELLDSSGMDIRATMFKEAVDKFYNLFQVGKVYTISGGKLKVANARYNTCKSQYEITLDTNCEIRLIDDIGEIQSQSFDFVKIAELERVEAEKTIDVLGVVQEIGEVQSLTSKKNGKELQKADVMLVDDTGASVRLTLWNSDAISAKSKFGINQVVGFRRCRVSDYGGKSLSGGTAFPEPQTPETAQLQQWWETQGRHGMTVKSLSSTGGGGRMDSFSDRKTIKDIKDQGLGYNNEKGDYITFKAHFTFMKKDKADGAWYTACPNKEEPCRNRCKVTQTTDGNWECMRCQGIFPNCNRKWIFSATIADDTASTWVSLFDGEALVLFDGLTADEAHARYDDQDFYDGIFAKANHSDWIMKCRVKNEIVNDEPRLKTQIVRLEPLDYVSESKEMLTALRGFQNMQ